MYSIVQHTLIFRTDDFSPIRILYELNHNLEQIVGVPTILRLPGNSVLENYGKFIEFQFESCKIERLKNFTNFLPRLKTHK